MLPPERACSVGEMTVVDLEICKNKPRFVTEILSKGRELNLGHTQKKHDAPHSKVTFGYDEDGDDDDDDDDDDDYNDDTEHW